MVVFLFIALIFCAAALLLQALDLKSDPLSTFELRRRIAAGDAAAAAIVEREKRLPKVRALRRFSLRLAWVLALGSAAASGLTVWLAVSVILLASPLLARQKLLRQWSQKLLKQYEPHITQVSHQVWLLTRLWAPKATARELAVQSVEELLHIAQNARNITDEEKDAITTRLQLHQEKIRSHMTPLVHMAQVGADEVLGPMTLDTLYRTGQPVFAVMQENEVVGLLYAEKIMTISAAGTTAAQAMDRDMRYVHRDQPVESIGQLAATSGGRFFLVVNDEGEVVGGIALETVLRLLFKKGTYKSYSEPRLAAKSMAAKRG